MVEIGVPPFLVGGFDAAPDGAVYGVVRFGEDKENGRKAISFPPVFISLNRYLTA